MFVSLLISLYCKSIIIGTDLTDGHTPSTTSTTLLETWVQMLGPLSKYTKHHCTPLCQKHTWSTVLSHKLANAATCKGDGGNQLRLLRNFQLIKDLQ